jgi:predicted NAD/FAD-dependent oxidoreductase
MPPSLATAAPRVAVVGGGLAGAAAARELVSRGAAVTVFDMGRRCLGGRAASGVGGGDHGCQLVAPADDGVAATLASLGGAASRWDGRFGVLDARSGAWADEGESGGFFGVGASRAPARGVWVGAPSSSSLAASLAAGADVKAGWRVTAVRDGAGGGFALTAAPPPPRGGAQPDPEPAGTYDGLILADASIVSRPGGAAEVAVVGRAAASAATATLKGSVRAPLFTATVALPPPWTCPFDVASIVHCADVAAIVRESGKPGRACAAGGGDTLALVSTPAAAAAMMEQLCPLSGGRPAPDALAAVAARLWRGAAAALARAGAPPPEPASLAAQRWGAGLETRPVRASHALDAGARLAACGDLFAGACGDRAGADAALASGAAAGGALAGALGL